jgi:hypothetical protein
MLRGHGDELLVEEEVLFFNVEYKSNVYVHYLQGNIQSVDVVIFEERLISSSETNGSFSQVEISKFVTSYEPRKCKCLFQFLCTQSGSSIYCSSSPYFVEQCRRTTRWRTDYTPYHVLVPP